MDIDTIVRAFKGAQSEVWAQYFGISKLERKMDGLEELIVFCASDDQCPLPDLMSEIAEKFGVSVECAARIFRSSKDFVIGNKYLKIERSERFWEDVKEINKVQFFEELGDKMLMEKTSPFFYISFSPRMTVA